MGLSDESMECLLILETYQMDINGKIIKQQMVETEKGSNNVAIDINAIPKGMYTVKLIAINGFGCVDSSFGMPTVFSKPFASCCFNSSSLY